MGNKWCMLMEILQLMEKMAQQLFFQFIKINVIYELVMFNLNNKQ